MARHCRGEGASGSVGRIGSLPLRFENFLLDSPPALVTQQIRSLLQVPAGDHHRGRSHLVQPVGGGPHLLEVANLQAGERRRLVDIRSDHVGQGNELLDEKPSSRAIQQIRPRGGLQDRINDKVGQSVLARP